jgi:hypothetical protein
MGSQQFQTYSRGKSVKEAYNNAVEDANDEYGHQQGYSGEINSSEGYSDVTAKFKASKKSLNEYINERLDVLTKFEGAEAICIEQPVTNNNKIKSQVEHVVEKGTKKWVLKFYAQSNYKGLIGKFNTKGDAVKAARKYTEETGNSTYVEMRKDLEKGNTITAKISYKKATNEKDGRWVFYGWASC